MISPRLAWELARKDLLLFLADRRGALMCFGVPVLLASLFGAIFHQPEEASPAAVRVAVVADDDGPFTRRVVEAMRTSDKLRAEICDLATARRRLANEAVRAIIVLPAGFDRVAARGAKSPPRVQILHHPRSQIEGRWVEGVLMEVVFREAARDWLAPLARLRPDLARLDRPFSVERSALTGAGALSVNAYSHSFCGMTLQYLLFWGVDSGLLLLRERRQGIWRRLRVAPVSSATLLAGKAQATALVALAQIAVTFTFGAVVFGVRLTGSPAGFALMALTSALLSAATGLLVAAAGGGHEARARSVAILVILTLSLLGGLWLPAFLLPEWVQKLSLGLPTTWAARGLEGVTWQGMDFAGAWPCALALTGFSAGFLVIAWWRLARLDAPPSSPLANSRLAACGFALAANREIGASLSPNGVVPMSRTSALITFLLLPATAIRAQQTSPPPVVIPVLAMEDQFEKPHDVRDHRGDVLVLIYGDRKSADANKALGELLHVTFHPTAKGLPPAQARKAPVQPLPGLPAGARSPDVLATPVACVGKVPALVGALIRSQMRTGSPDVPVWLDFADLMKAQFPFQPGVPNVVVLDAQGRYRYAAGGTPTKEGTQRLVDVIEALRKDAVTGK
jgi:ABC-2 type transport system permease protein